MAREINLVPNVKEEMIKALKLRNFIFFLCIVVASASIVVTAIFGTIMLGQQSALNGKKDMIDSLSSKLNSYGDLNEFLTIKDQLGNIATLTSNKKVLSRTFNILSALIPTGSDTVTVSELNVNLADGQPVFTFDAQADAKTAPFIDYAVLEAFKKSMQDMRYDYGSYVDKNGLTIPAYCMIETGQDGATFKDAEKGFYAFWTIDAEGCNPSPDTKTVEYSTTDYNGVKVVRIWRTPQYSDWYKKTKIEGEPYMSLDGQISGVEHFESACTSYFGFVGGNGEIKWDKSNTDCLLVVSPSTSTSDTTDSSGIKISDSSNGRNSDNQLVLRFSATIYLSPEVYDFNNTHVLALPPANRRNVTDSYLQLQNIFGERASDCAEDDTACSANTNNVTGEGEQ